MECFGFGHFFCVIRESLCLKPTKRLVLFNSDHSSLLKTFGLNATSTYDSYLSLTFGNFALIWGHFQNISVCHFLGRWGCPGQTTSKSKMTKILNENLLKLDEIQNLASAASKMTSWPQRPRKGLSELFQKCNFWNQWIKLRKMSYSLAF